MATWADELIDDDLQAQLSALVAPAEVVFFDAKIESELVELDDEEALELLESVGQQESGLSQSARVGCETLGPGNALNRPSPVA